MSADPLRHALRAGVATAAVVWLAGGIWLGVDWGRRLRYSGDRLDHPGPVWDAIINFLFVMIGPAAFAGIVVFAAMAWWAERSAR